MKQHFTLLLLLFFSLNINAQNISDYTYDELKNLSPEILQKLTFSKNPTPASSIQANQRTEYQLDSAYFFPLPDDVVEQKRYYNYNSLGSGIGNYTLRWNSSNNVWENYRKFDIGRDMNDQIISFTFFEANPSSLEWEVDTKVEYTLDNNGNPTQAIQLLWDEVSSSFVNTLRWEYNYNADTLIESRYSYVWDLGTSDWNNSLLTTYTYDSNKNVTEELTQIWLLNVYNNNSKRLYEYDTLQNRVRQTFQFWDEVFLVWNDNFRYNYIYVNDLFVARYTQLWADQGFGLDWVSSAVHQYSHDAAGNRTQDLYSEYNFDNEMWEENWRWEFYFSEFDPTHISTVEETTLNCIFQNPIRTGEIINCQDLTLDKKYNLIFFDLSGKILLEKNFQGDVDIELPSFLKSGVYFMNVLEEGGLVRKEKIVVID